MKPKIDPQMLLYGAAALALIYVVYKGTKALGSAVDAVAGAPGKALSAAGKAAADVWDAATAAANSAWHTTADIFAGSSVEAGTTTTPRTVDPVGGTFKEGATNALDPFDLRYYGVQGNTILQAQTATAGPGGGSQAGPSSSNSSDYFSSTDPMGSMTGM
jgi:hypothetical protein